MPPKNADARDAAVDEIDAGWEDDDDSDDADLDAGWDEIDSGKTPEEREREWHGLTPEEREARVARAAARKEKLRSKAAAKAERRKARASLAKAKQKTKQKIQRPRKERAIAESSQEEAGFPAAHESPRDRESGPRVRDRRNDPRVLALLLAIVLVAAGVALFLWKR